MAHFRFDRIRTRGRVWVSEDKSICHIAAERRRWRQWGNGVNFEYGNCGDIGRGYEIAQFYRIV